MQNIEFKSHKGLVLENQNASFFFNTQKYLDSFSIQNVVSFKMIKSSKLILSTSIFSYKNIGFAPLQAPWASIEKYEDISIEDLNLFLKFVSDSMSQYGFEKLQINLGPDSSFDKNYFNQIQKSMVLNGFEKMGFDSIPSVDINKISSNSFISLANNIEMEENIDLIQVYQQYIHNDLLSMKSISQESFVKMIQNNASWYAILSYNIDNKTQTFLPVMKIMENKVYIFGTTDINLSSNEKLFLSVIAFFKVNYEELLIDQVFFGNPFPKSDLLFEMNDEFEKNLWVLDA